ncbi:mechanosensitive ion channel-like protein [Palleronia aestuarii]|uniref:Mechanosensitive ion channel-like protein n=1 Tax=Palleronia aestuarii TaxID=568105 RepID=A0A2W7Q754_9RHOB|nr:mechanosensitive ion channel domain-containing protein [Palleronia aestuarii]PZX17599.1 mechanosensitive ion channel-like protein [Palleronia aestuarii]
MDPLEQVETAIAPVAAQVPEPVWPWLIVSVGALAAIAVHRFLWRAVLRIVRGRSGLLPSLVRRLKRPSRLFFLVLAIGLLVNVAGLPSEWRAGLSHAAVALLIVIAGWIVSLAIDVSCDRFLARLNFEADEINSGARSQATQIRMIQRLGRIIVGVLTAGLVLSTFDSVRQFGVSLFASAGAAGLVLGFAARPVLANLIAGIQIALTQPIRLDDVVIVEGEWGWIEEIAATYVVVRIWDLRRMIVPLSYFIEQPFENWTRDSGQIIGAVTLHLDYTAPMGAIREKVMETVKTSRFWDGDVVNLQVIEADRESVQIRALMSARNSPTAWELRCDVRERLLGWLQETHPEALPRIRAELQPDRSAPSMREGTPLKSVLQG